MPFCHLVFKRIVKFIPNIVQQKTVPEKSLNQLSEFRTFHSDLLEFHHIITQRYLCALEKNYP